MRFPNLEGKHTPRLRVVKHSTVSVFSVTEIGLTDLCKMAEGDDIRKYTLLNPTTKDVICSCLSQNQFRNIMHLNHAKVIWDRLFEVYEGHRTHQDPWFEDFKESLKEMTFAPESSSTSPCLMAKGAKVTECYLSESSDYESGDEFGPSYVKLASLATKQQRALEKSSIHAK